MITVDIAAPRPTAKGKRRNVSNYPLTRSHHINAQAELRGLTISRTAAASSGLWLGSTYPVFFNSSFTTRRIIDSNGSLRCLICSFNALFIMV